MQGVIKGERENEREGDAVGVFGCLATTRSVGESAAAVVAAVAVAVADADADAVWVWQLPTTRMMMMETTEGVSWCRSLHCGSVPSQRRSLLGTGGTSKCVCVCVMRCCFCDCAYARATGHTANAAAAAVCSVYLIIIVITAGRLGELLRTERKGEGERGRERERAGTKSRQQSKAMDDDDDDEDDAGDDGKDDHNAAVCNAADATAVGGWKTERKENAAESVAKKVLKKGAGHCHCNLSNIHTRAHFGIQCLRSFAHTHTHRKKVGAGVSAMRSSYSSLQLYVWSSSAAPTQPCASTRRVQMCSGSGCSDVPMWEAAAEQQQQQRWPANTNTRSVAAFSCLNWTEQSCTHTASLWLDRSFASSPARWLVRSPFGDTAAREGKARQATLHKQCLSLHSRTESASVVVMVVCACACVCVTGRWHTHTQAPYGDNDNYEESEIVVVGHYCRWLNTAPLQTHYRVTHWNEGGSICLALITLLPRKTDSDKGNLH